MACPVSETDVIDAAYAVMGSRFEWGRDKSDCASSALRVYGRLFGVDLASYLAPYSSRDQAEDYISRYGGLLMLASSIADKAGMERGFHTGCIGLSPDINSLMVGIRPNLWVGKGLRGMRMQEKALVSWGCENYFS